MVDLVLCPSGLPEPERAFALQLRYHESVGETEYRTLCRVSEPIARQIIDAGSATWLFGDPSLVRGGN